MKEKCINREAEEESIKTTGDLVFYYIIAKCQNRILFEKFCKYSFNHYFTSQIYLMQNDSTL